MLFTFPPDYSQNSTWWMVCSLKLILLILAPLNAVFWFLIQWHFQTWMKVRTPWILLAAMKPNLCHETLCQKIFCLFSSNGFVCLYFCSCFPITFVQVATVHSKLRTALDAGSFWPKFVPSAFLGNHSSKRILMNSSALLPHIHFLL